MQPSYAVLFKTHFWDAFTTRQIDRLRQNVKHGTIVIVVDETFGPVAVSDEAQVVRVTTQKIDDLGLAKVTTHGSILWYNTDYPNYIALRELQPFDYYVTVEYDAVCNLDLDQFVADLAAREIDYVGQPVTDTIADWTWFETHRTIYGDAMLGYLSCVAAFSHRALEQLLKRRQEMTLDFRQGRLAFWPIMEAFIPNEIHNAGYTIGRLGSFGSITQYDWWPPKHEDDLGTMTNLSFIHPVLTGDRYVKSLVYHEPSVRNFFRADSNLRRQLRIHARGRETALLYGEFRRRLFAAAARRLASVGIGSVWYKNAKAGAAAVEQTKSAHN